MQRQPRVHDNMAFLLSQVRSRRYFATSYLCLQTAKTVPEAVDAKAAQVETHNVTTIDRLLVQVRECQFASCIIQSAQWPVYQARVQTRRFAREYPRLLLNFLPLKTMTE